MTMAPVAQRDSDVVLRELERRPASPLSPAFHGFLSVILVPAGYFLLFCLLPGLLLERVVRLRRFAFRLNGPVRNFASLCHGTLLL